MIQREGRILREGNENKRVYIYRYLTDGSFDAYSWQLLESKQRFICQLLSGSIAERSASDVDEAVLSYAEIKALAIGNPLIKKRVETANELYRVSVLQRRLLETRERIKEELLFIPGKIKSTSVLISKAKSDTHRYKANLQKGVKDRRQYGAVILEALRDYEMKPEKKPLIRYQGFDIVLPDNMLREKPYVWLHGDGWYSVDVGESDIGCITRIENRLEGLPDFVAEQEQKLQTLMQRSDDIKKELADTGTYNEKIERLQKKLQAMDKKLGVEKK